MYNTVIASGGRCNRENAKVYNTMIYFHHKVIQDAFKSVFSDKITLQFYYHNIGDVLKNKTHIQ